MKICDRCGSRLPHPLAQTRNLPTYTIIGYYDIIWKRPIDLCPKCESEFTEWLKELKNEEYKE